MKNPYVLGILAIIVLVSAGYIVSLNSGEGVTGQVTLDKPTFFQRLFNLEEKDDTIEGTVFTDDDSDGEDGSDDLSLDQPELDFPTLPGDEEHITISVFYKPGAGESPKKPMLYKRFADRAENLLQVEFFGRDVFSMDAKYLCPETTSRKGYLHLLMRNIGKNALINTKWAVLNGKIASLGPNLVTEDPEELLISEEGVIMGTSNTPATVTLSSGVPVYEPEANANNDKVNIGSFIMEFKGDTSDLSDAAHYGYGSMESAIYLSSPLENIILTGGDFEKKASEVWILVEELVPVSKEPLIAIC